MNEAALLAGRRGLDQIGVHQLEEAIDRVMAGPERRSRLISDGEKRVIAYHEGGHALVSHALPHTDPVHKVSIIPRGRALGYTLTLPTEDRFLVRRSELVDELAMLLGGRSAEELIFADPTTGAQNDIERATTIARQMVTEFGMSETARAASLRPARRARSSSAATSPRRRTTRRRSRRASTTRCASCIDGAHDVARHDPDRRTGPRSTALAAALIEHETLEADQVARGPRRRRTLDPRRTTSGGARPSAVATSEHTLHRAPSHRAGPDREEHP